MATVDQQIINTQLNAKIDIQNTKIDAFIDEMRDFKNELRDRDNQRANEIKANREEMKSIAKHVQNLTVASLIGIGAMALSGGAIAVTVIYSVLNSIPK